MTKTTRNDRIVSVAKLLYGDRWQSPMLWLVGVSPSLLTKIAAGANSDQRAVTDDVYGRVAESLIGEAGRMRKVADKVEGAGRKMRSKLGD
ncbi:hypothetical protein IP86_02610 [Rhodopseudomonas sp. AAP120]|uniref:Uncharacterized protein n=1 Tax=Rhodopseudomonas palustris (strain BisB5) TaxID=316057 RepID=Q138S3_RHOPS|nr:MULTISPECIES: hypothetical protein [Rhodopseudomonas]ABE39416.1 hypothetical protein RPD_2181 [Rhodopseudomonas palustris BisB5]ACF00853.1 hypothetical protein Rpal_2338 [Rhodopseudomonas palustris TIE-1]KPG01723.1 hypothetical protein IP86_02610 [Rhodopseudomonas sp. AAP120]